MKQRYQNELDLLPVPKEAEAVFSQFKIPARRFEHLRLVHKCRELNRYSPASCSTSPAFQDSKIYSRD